MFFPVAVNSGHIQGPLKKKSLGWGHLEIAPPNNIFFRETCVCPDLIASCDDVLKMLLEDDLRVALTKQQNISLKNLHNYIN